jgi:hypothetical protein
MNASNLPFSILLRRIFLVFVVTTSSIFSIVELGPVVLTPNLNVAQAMNAGSRGVSRSNASLSTYRWNFHDDGMPLISLPAQTGRAGRSELRQTWAVADRALLANMPLAGALFTRLERAKRIPTNAVTPGYTKDMVASDAVLAAIFGGQGAVAAGNGFEPGQLNAQYPLYRGDLVADGGRILRGHLSFAMHLYGSGDGTGDTELYVPAGSVSNSTTPTPTDAAVTFYYPQLGNFSDVTLAVFHVADFQIRPEGRRVRIGNIGGRGGSNGTYKHSHVEFYRGDTGLPSAAARVRLRIDPAVVFSSSPKMTSRVRCLHRC